MDEADAPESLKFTVFHAGPKESLEPYLPLMEISRKALEVTNPGARYVVLTDPDTAPLLQGEFEVAVLAPPDTPLMRQYMVAQREYLKMCGPGLVVLAATDCVANLDLSKATDKRHGLAITYRRRGRHLINNIAYVRNHGLGVWFLDRALGLMRAKNEEFWGDQESWQAALGPFEDWKLSPKDEADDHQDSVRTVKIEGRVIHLYPCRTHNFFSKNSGAQSKAAEQACLWHFKGPRKIVMVDSVKRFILNEPEVEVSWKKNKLLYTDDLVYPMQARAGREPRKKKVR